YITAVLSFTSAGKRPYFFFFSSRRRHTRFSRDWSSDVCSSDLLEEAWLYEAMAECYIPLLDRLERLAEEGVPYHLSFTLTPTLRSEERRVGKECGCRGSARH